MGLTDWIPIEQGGASAQATSNLRSTSLWIALQSIDAFRSHLEKCGEEGNDVAAAINFDLAKHPATRIFLIVIGLLTIVLFADNLLTSEAWAEWRLRYILPHTLIGCLVGIGVGRWLLQVRTPRKIPHGIAITLAWLTMLVGGIASWLGGIHLNQCGGGWNHWKPTLTPVMHSAIPCSPRKPIYRPSNIHIKLQTTGASFPKSKSTLC